MVDGSEGRCAGSRTIIPSDTSLTCLPLHSRTVPVSDVQITTVYAYRSMDHSDARVTYIGSRMGSPKTVIYHPFHINLSHMVAERDYPRTSERIERLIVDALIPLILEETVDVVRLISQEHIQRHMVKEPVGVSVPQDAIEDCNKDQLSNTTARIEAVEKSISELHESMINNAAATELLKLAVNRLQAEAPFEVRNTSYRDEMTSQATEKKEDLEADTAKHSSVLETAVSRSTLDGEVSSRDRIPQHTMEQTLGVLMPEMVTQSVEVPKTISQNRIQQRTMKQIVDDPVVQIVQIPQVHVVEKTAEIPVMTQRHTSRDGVQQRTVEHIVDAPVPQTVKKLTEVSKVFSQDRIQQCVVEQTIEDPAIPLVEKTVEMPVIRTKEKTQHVVNTHVQHVVNTVEVERPKLIKETQHRKKPIINEKINQVTKDIKIPQMQFLNKVDDMLLDVQQQIRPMTQTVQKTTEIPQLQFLDQVVDVPVMVQRQVSSIETVQKTVEVPQTQSIVKELRSKFEVGHTSELRSLQKTVEVPRVQYIDKVADIPVNMQRQVSTTQAAQDIEEVEDVPALTQSEVPNIPDDDEDWLEQESKKRKLPMPADADESDFDRFDDLVLPSPERKIVFISIASGDEAEDGSDKEQEITRSLVQGGESMLVDETDAQAPERELVQAVHDVASDMSDVKNELAHVREMVGVLVRRERSAEHKAEAATRRLDRMEREQTEADDAEHEANLQEALANQSKAVKVLVDKWFVDKGFGKAPTGEIVFIHASAVQGAEVLTIGTDAWVQVVNDDARAQGRYRAKRAWGRNAWKAERDKENANKVAQQVRRAAALTAELAAQSEKKTAAVCDQPPGLDELAGHIEAPNMGAGGSHPQATMMPDPWATEEEKAEEEEEEDGEEGEGGGEREGGEDN